MRIQAEFNGSKITVNDQTGIYVQLPDGSDWLMISENPEIHDLIFDWVADIMDA